jgi:hypothetical protein
VQRGAVTRLGRQRRQLQGSCQQSMHHHVRIPALANASRLSHMIHSVMSVPAEKRQMLDKRSAGIGSAGSRTDGNGSRGVKRIGRLAVGFTQL